MPEQTSISEMADSGRGSWTSCSSNSHDNLQTLPGQRASDLLNHRHTPMGGPIAEVEIGPGLPEDSCSRDGSELSQSRQSWTSSSSLSDTYEGSYGTIKRKTQDQQSIDASYKTITSSTEKGLIGELRLLRVTPADFTVLSLDDKCAALLARLCLDASRTLVSVKRFTQDVLRFPQIGHKLVSRNQVMRLIKVKCDHFWQNESQ